MDFFSLSRKELQFLSKKNKIPANQTNLAMAEALSSLSQVEGLDEILNPVEGNPNQFQEEMAIGTPNIHHSRTAISTRRKDVSVAVSASAMTSISTCRKKKDAALESDEHPIDHILKTPAAPTTTTRQYNTRRSTRFLEKNLSKMSLIDSEDFVGSVKFNDVTQQTQESVEPEEHDSDLKLVESSKACNDSIEVKEVQEDKETDLVEPVDSTAPMEVTNQAIDAFNFEVTDNEGRNAVAIMEVIDNEGRNEVATMEVTDNEGRNEVATMEVTDNEGRNEVATMEVTDNEGRNEVATMEVTDNEGRNEVASMEVTADHEVADLTVEVPVVASIEATNTLVDDDGIIPEEIVITKQESTISVETNIDEISFSTITDAPIFEQKTTDIVADQLKGEDADQLEPKDIVDEHMEEEDKNTMKENSLQDMSIAQLKKMLKNLTLDGKPNSKDNNVGKEMDVKRIALQPLAENKMICDETKNGY